MVDKATAQRRKDQKRRRYETSWRYKTSQSAHVCISPNALYIYINVCVNIITLSNRQESIEAGIDAYTP